MKKCNQFFVSCFFIIINLEVHSQDFLKTAVNRQIACVFNIHATERKIKKDIANYGMFGILIDMIRRTRRKKRESQINIPLVKILINNKNNIITKDRKREKKV